MLRSSLHPIPADSLLASIHSLAAHTEGGAPLVLAPCHEELLGRLRALASSGAGMPLRRPVELRVPAGSVTELHAGRRAGSPVLVPAPGSVPGLDEARERITVYRVERAGRVEGREVPEGARVLVSRRRAERGEWVAYVGERCIGLAVQGARGWAALPEGARVVGMVEAILSEGPTRRCA